MIPIWPERGPLDHRNYDKTSFQNIYKIFVKTKFNVVGNVVEISEKINLGVDRT